MADAPSARKVKSGLTNADSATKRWEDTWLGRRGMRIIVWKLRPLRTWRFYLRRPMHNCEYLNELLRRWSPAGLRYIKEKAWKLATA